MAQEQLTRLADSIPNEECYSLKDLASELGVGEQMARKVIDKALKSRSVQNLTKQEGAKRLYAPQMAEKIVELYHQGQLGKHRKKQGGISKSALKHAALVITVPVFDAEIADALSQRFENEQTMVKYLQDELIGAVKNDLDELKKLEAEFEHKKRSIFKKK